ncbi:hypothetical protein BDQ17DRAFT_1546371 [Cyathus striatus]|nr:hypothetical protein BDQ17DRAFT_1546371 [Cyathus striatus]
MSNITEKSNDPFPQAIYPFWDTGAYYERKHYYYGLPSKPISLFRIGAPFQRPTGPEAYRVPKINRPVFDDKFAAVWEDMGTRIYKYLDSVSIKWTTIDVAHFAEPMKYDPFLTEETVGPIVLWIGVIPTSLPRELAEEAAYACKNILLSFDFGDVEVAFRESIFRRYTRTLLDYVPTEDPVSAFCGPLTAALGLPIASIQTPSSEGTGGIYLSSGDNIYLLTTRHVVLPREVPNIVYDHRQSSQDAVQVKLPGPIAFNDMFQSITDKIDFCKKMTVGYEMQLNKLQRKENTDDAEKERARIESDLNKPQTAAKKLEDFKSNVINDWTQGDFIIGHVVYAPAISVCEGSRHNSEDWALIELDRSKINWPKFKGNMFDLEMKVDKYGSLMCPHQDINPKYPQNRLSPIHGVVPEDELTKQDLTQGQPSNKFPKTQWAQGRPYNKLIKNGGRTKTTIGIGNGIKSFVREYLSDGTEQTSLEFAIFPQDMHLGFSQRGDSGSVIVDSEGRAAALLIGGCGSEEFSDITYATPFKWLLERIKSKFPDIQLYPTEGVETIGSRRFGIRNFISTNF